MKNMQETRLMINDKASKGKFTKEPVFHQGKKEEMYQHKSQIT